MPSMRPAIIDSHGNPGTAGKVIGVEYVLVLLVGVLIMVSVDTEVVTDVTVRELVAVTGSVEAEEDDDVVTCDVPDDELDVLSVVVFDAVACWPTVGGIAGSRWKMPVRVLFPVSGCAPTAQPSVGLVVKTE